MMIGNLNTNGIILRQKKTRFEMVSDFTLIYLYKLNNSVLYHYFPQQFAPFNKGKLLQKNDLGINFNKLNLPLSLSHILLSKQW